MFEAFSVFESTSQRRFSFLASSLSFSAASRTLADVVLSDTCLIENLLVVKGL